MTAAALLLMLAAPGQYEAQAVPDLVLERERGGFQLPNGVNVAITVQTQTVLDGAVVLRTVFQANEGKPSFTAYVPKPGETVAAPAALSAQSAGGSGSMPVVTYDRQGGIQVTPAAVTPAVSIGTVRGSAAAADGTAGGLVAVDPAAGAITDAGLVSRTDRAGVSIARLEAPDLSVSHLAGGAFGSAVANSGSDRAIDTTTAISIDLSNAGPDVLGSAMLRVQDISSEAIRGRF